MRLQSYGSWDENIQGGFLHTLGALVVSARRLSPLCLPVDLPLGQLGLLFIVAGSQESTFNKKEAEVTRSPKLWAQN